VTFWLSTNSQPFNKSIFQANNANCSDQYTSQLKKRDLYLAM
jgi:hypothetical protein